MFEVAQSKVSRFYSVSVVYFLQLLMSVDSAQGSEKTFDEGMLKQLGLDPKLSEFFSKAPRFTPGVKRVQVMVNGQPKGSVQAVFDQQGELYFTEEFVRMTGLSTPDKRFKLTSSLSQDKEIEYFQFIEAFPGSEINLFPEKEEVVLVVPSRAVRPPKKHSDNYVVGGSGAFINYDVLGVHNSFGSSKTQYYTLNTEFGVNVKDWIVRSRQMTTVYDGEGDFQSIYTYAQKSYMDHEVTLQLGQVDLSGSAFPSVGITGFQIVPDQALKNTTGARTIVEGVAYSPSRVEVRQSGILLYSTIVQAGPFVLDDIRPSGSIASLRVKVIEQDGREQEFEVEAASLVLANLNTSGYSFAAGKARTFGVDDSGMPTIASSTGAWRLGSESLGTGGVMLSSQRYQGLALGVEVPLADRTRIKASSVYSLAQDEGVQGVQAGIQVDSLLTPDINIGVLLQHQTDTYRSVLDSAGRDRLEAGAYVGQSQVSTSLGWAVPKWGSFKVGYSYSRLSTGRYAHHVNSGWSANFKGVIASLNVDRTISTTSDGMGRSPRGGLFATLSIPLGSGRSLRSYVNKIDQVTRVGSSYTDNSSDFATYRQTVERNLSSSSDSHSGSLNLNTRYAQANAGYSQNDRSNSFNGRLRGGAVMAHDAVLLSPNPLQETFAVATLEGVADVKLNTPSGPVWTNKNGKAVVARMNAYEDTKVEVATNTLPRYLDVKNGRQVIRPSRGAVPRYEFTTVSSRGILLEVVDGEQLALPKGALVLDAQGELVTTLVDQGLLFLYDGGSGKELYSESVSGRRCIIEFKIPNIDKEAYVDNAKAVCRFIG